MTYIYDIVLNFHTQYYRFFEWQKKDKLLNIRKIPLIRVTDADYLNLKYQKIKVNTSFIDKISSTNTLYSSQKIGPICLVSNTKEVMGLLFDNNGNLLKRSSLLFDEEDEVLNEVDLIDITTIDYTGTCQDTNIFLARYTKEKKDYLLNFLTNKPDPLILKYLYYDYYEKDANPNINIAKTLLNEIEGEWSSSQDNLYKLTVLINSNKQEQR